MRCAIIVYEWWGMPQVHVFPGSHHSDKVLARKADRWAQLHMSAEAYETCTITLYGNALDRDTAQVIK
ncbi:hypothetical protein SEA_LUCKYSOCKE_199 [Streptomyces phage LuckySocke]|nr:hypothetical protein SEA_LUCKYSOCKE_199 [Streptomyces phage LuckySocke]